MTCCFFVNWHTIYVRFKFIKFSSLSKINGIMGLNIFYIFRVQIIYYKYFSQLFPFMHFSVANKNYNINTLWRIRCKIPISLRSEFGCIGGLMKVSGNLCFHNFFLKPKENSAKRIILGPIGETFLVWQHFLFDNIFCLTTFFV